MNNPRETVEMVHPKGGRMAVLAGKGRQAAREQAEARRAGYVTAEEWAGMDAKKRGDHQAAEKQPWFRQRRLAELERLDSDAVLLDDPAQRKAAKEAAAALRKELKALGMLAHEETPDLSKTGKAGGEPAPADSGGEPAPADSGS